MSTEKIELQITKTRAKLKKLEAQARHIREREAMAATQKLAEAAKLAGVDLASMSAAEIAQKLAVKE